MRLTSLTSADFKRIVKLLEGKEKLQAALAKIEGELARFAGEPAEVRGGKKRAVARGPVQKRPRGQVKEAIVQMLKRGGKTGVTVKEISTRLGVSTGRIYTWFYSTGKNVPQIRKIGEARYRWED